MHGLGDTSGAARNYRSAFTTSSRREGRRLSAGEGIYRGSCFTQQHNQTPTHQISSPKRRLPIANKAPSRGRWSPGNHSDIGYHVRILIFIPRLVIRERQNEQAVVAG